MLIGELSSKTGLSRDTIRFYEKNGLISLKRKERRENNYKEYSEETFMRLLLIKRIKNFGFTLNEISDFLNLIEDNRANCNKVSTMMASKIKIIDDKIKELTDFKNLIIDSVEKCKSSCSSVKTYETCPVLISDVF